MAESKNLTKVKWAHAVNSQDLLTIALGSSIDMIEADIILGYIKDEPNSQLRPVMGHPPNTESDITLENFLKRILKYNSDNADKSKGVKLDFKSTEVFEGSLAILSSIWHLMTYSVWLNADIIPGPVDNVSTLPVAPKNFFDGAKLFSNALLSIGWTTRWGEDFREGQYLKAQVDDMIRAIQDNNITETGHALTFPVRAGIVASSTDIIKDLLDSIKKTNNVTLTIWSSPNDYVNIDKLRDFIYRFGVDKIYLDVPEEVSDMLNLKSNASLMSRINCYGLLGLLSFSLTIYLLRRNH